MSTTTIDAADITTSTELKMSTHDAAWLARGLLAAAATEEVFGVKCHAHIVADGLTAVCTTTDGYRLHETSAPTPVNLDFLADARNLATTLTDVPTIRYTGGDDKPGPALLDFWEGGVLRATALIQPSKVEDDE